MLSSRAPQRQESVRFALAGPIPRKKTPVEGLYWTRAGGRRVGYRPLGGVQAPAARASGSGISQNGRSPVLWSASSGPQAIGKMRSCFRNSSGELFVSWGLRR